jgi:hypothetical protein
MKNISTSKKPMPKLVVAKDKDITLTISPIAGAKIQMMCLLKPNTEWSGTILYFTTGSVAENNLHVSVEDFYLMDIHEVAATDYNHGEDSSFQTYYKESGAAKKRLRYGHCHSHHTMTSYFSNVDDEELQESTGAFNKGYLSLIVNNKMEMVARMCFFTKANVSYSTVSSYFDADGKEVKNTEAVENNLQEMVLAYDINDIVYFEDPFVDRYKEVCEISEKRRKSHSKVSTTFPISNGRIGFFNQKSQVEKGGYPISNQISDLHLKNEFAKAVIGTEEPVTMFQVVEQLREQDLNKVLKIAIADDVAKLYESKYSKIMSYDSYTNRLTRIVNVYVVNHFIKEFLKDAIDESATLPF